MARLVVEKGAAVGTEYELPAYASVLGRGSAADFVLDDPRISRQHACVRLVHGAWAALDLGTSNGTFVDGERIEDWTPLHPGSRLRVGHTVLRLEDVAPEAPTPKAESLPEVPGHEVIEQVGSGATGAVYRARHVALDRTVAVKVLGSELARRPENVERFVQEARAAAALSHPHVVPVFEVGRSGNLHYFTMEFMEGGTVEDRLLSAPRSRLAWREAVAHAAGAAKGIAYLHQCGFVHRDIKPANLLLDAQDVVKVGDMGTVVRVEEAVAARIGTPHYMSPEQARREPVTRASDVYSLGATLYRMLSGETPHHGADVRAIVAAVANEEPEPIGRLCPSLRPEVVALVGELLARDPARRPKDAAVVGERLTEALQEVRAARELDRRTQRRRREVSAWLVRFGLLAVVAAGLWVLRGPVLRGLREVLGVAPQAAAPAGPSVPDVPGPGGTATAPASPDTAGADRVAADAVAAEALTEVRGREHALDPPTVENVEQWRALARDYERLAEVFPLKSDAVLRAHWRAKEIRDRIADITGGDAQTLAFADRWVERALRDDAPRRVPTGPPGTAPGDLPAGLDTASLADAREAVLRAAEARLAAGEVQGALDDVLDWVRAERLRAREADAPSATHEAIAVALQWVRHAASSASARLERDLERDRELLRMHLPPTALLGAPDVAAAADEALERLAGLEPLMLTHLGAARVQRRAARLESMRAALAAVPGGAQDLAAIVRRLRSGPPPADHATGDLWLAIEAGEADVAAALLAQCALPAADPRAAARREIAALRARDALDDTGGPALARWLAAFPSTDTTLFAAGPLVARHPVFPAEDVDTYYETWGERPAR